MCCPVLNGEWISISIFMTLFDHTAGSMSGQGKANSTRARLTYLGISRFVPKECFLFCSCVTWQEQLVRVKAKPQWLVESAGKCLHFWLVEKVPRFIFFSQLLPSSRLTTKLGTHLKATRNFKLFYIFYSHWWELYQQKKKPRLSSWQKDWS